MIVRHQACQCFSIGPRFVKNGCALALRDRSAVWIDCDRCLAFGEHERRPDIVALVFGGPSPNTWLVAEMKSKAADGRAIVRQLQAGADVVAAHEDFAFESAPDRLEAVVLHGSGLKTAARDSIARSRIRYMGHSVGIRTARCGGTM